MNFTDVFLTNVASEWESTHTLPPEGQLYQAPRALIETITRIDPEPLEVRNENNNMRPKLTLALYRACESFGHVIERVYFIVILRACPKSYVQMMIHFSMRLENSTCAATSHKGMCEKK